MISFALGNVKEGDGVQVTGTVRTSGTEPKVCPPEPFLYGREPGWSLIRLFCQIKFYLEASGADRSRVEYKLARVREGLGTEWLRWEEFGLERA